MSCSPRELGLDRIRNWLQLLWFPFDFCYIRRLGSVGVRSIDSYMGVWALKPRICGWYCKIIVRLVNHWRIPHVGGSLPLVDFVSHPTIAMRRQRDFARCPPIRPGTGRQQLHAGNHECYEYVDGTHDVYSDRLAIYIIYTSRILIGN